MIVLAGSSCCFCWCFLLLGSVVYWHLTKAPRLLSLNTSINHATTFCIVVNFALMCRNPLGAIMLPFKEVVVAAVVVRLLPPFPALTHKQLGLK
jgi:hypothetical protein